MNRISCALVVVLATASSAVAAPLFEEQVLWTSGEDGYHTYRIPALLVSKAGSALAFCEGRKTAGGDHGDLDLLMKRSTDGGRTWSPHSIVYEEGGDAKITIGNPCPVVDEPTATIWLPFCRDNKQVLITSSDDDGRTWSPPRDITNAVVKDDWVWVATGPGVGIQLKQGANKGRLVIPCDHRRTLPDKSSEWNSHMMYSDDHGKTWKIGEPISAGGNECQVIERSDGTLLVNTRMQGHFQGLRGLATSTDGGVTFTSIEHEKQLPCPKCQGSMIQLTAADAKQPPRVLASNPWPPQIDDGKPSSSRVNLTLRTSADEGRTWTVAKQLHAGPSAYSCLAQLPDGTLLCLYEGGPERAYSHLRLARFNAEWLAAPDARDQSAAESRSLPTVDLAGDTARQVVVAAGTRETYQGHPTTVLLPDGRTMFAVWTLNHGGPCGPMKRSDDGGKTWSDLLSVPENWSTVKNCPTIYRLADPQGVSRLVVFGGQGPDGLMHVAHSTDDGRTWSPMQSIGLRCVMPFCTIVPIDDGKQLLGLTNIRRPGETKDPRSNIIAQSLSSDGGLTWSDWRIVLDLGALKPCEPEIVRSPDGKQLLCLLRENARHEALYMTSDDEGRTWSKAQTLPPGLWGDRHKAAYSSDGRLVVCFRDTGKQSPTRTHFAAWIGKYDDIASGRDGQYRVKLLHSHAGGDCGYPGLEVLPGGTLVATTYVKYRPGPEKHSVVAVRFNLNETDELAKTTAVAGVVEADVVIYGGTSGGVAAAVQASRMGKRAAIIEPGKHLGGMTSGGLSAVDIGDPRTVGGIAREYFTRLVARYGKQLEWDKAFATVGGGPATGGAYSIEPHVAEGVFNGMARDAGVGVHLSARLKSVKKDGPRIVELTTESGLVVRGKMFIDATYEGDLMAAAGVTYTVAREGNKKYNETYNGIYYDKKYEPRTNHQTPGPHGRVPGGQGVWDRDFPLDPYVVPGDPQSGLLPLIDAGDPGKPGESAPGVQAYCYRLCLTKAADRLPIAPPADYDPQRYEIVARFIAACQAIGDDVDLRWFSKHDALPNHKWDFNTATFGGNLPGASWAWPEASYAERERIVKEHENYHRGLLHFLATDDRVPSKVREEIRQFGLPRDEFQDNGGWPHQMYVREARRMVSDLVMTEHHTFGRVTAPNSVSLGSYGTDTHEIRRIVRNGVVQREGKTAMGRDGAPPYPIGYGAIVPPAQECDNLFVTFALSASHTAFSSIRMEPVFMVTSQSAATAAAIAIDDGVPVQQVDYAKLRKRLDEDKQIVEWQVAKADDPAAAAEADAIAKWSKQAEADAKQDRTTIIYDGITPNKMVCDTTLRQLPDGTWILFFLAGGDTEPSPLNYTAVARSTDEGRTWSKAEEFDTTFPREGKTIGQGPTELMIVDGRCTLFFSTHSNHWRDDWQSWIMSSDDSGRTWTKPEPAPGRLKNRTFLRDHIVCRDGRLMVPFQHYIGPENEQHLPPHDRKFTNPRNGVIISRDGGRTWTEHGNIRLTENDQYFGWAENNLAELSDGRIAMIIRADRLGGVLYYAESKDGGVTWPEFAVKSDIPNPGSKATLYGLGGDTVAILHNPNPAHRSPMAIWISFDGLKTWPYRRVLQAESVDGPKGRMNYPDGFVSADKQHLHFAFDDNRHRAVYYGAKLPPLEK